MESMKDFIRSRFGRKAPAKNTQMSNQLRISSFDRKQREHQKQEQDYWQKQLFIGRLLNWITLTGTLVAGVGLLFIHNSIQDNESATFEANRAWVTPTYLESVGPLLAGNDLPLQIYYENAGKGPALGFSYYFNYKTLIDPDPKNASAIDAGFNAACLGVAENPNAVIVFSNTGTIGFIPFTIPSRAVTAAVVNGQDAIVLDGCFVYKTMDKSKVLNFCFLVVRAGVVADKSGTTSCADGYYAD